MKGQSDAADSVLSQPVAGRAVAGRIGACRAGSGRVNDTGDRMTWRLRSARVADAEALSAIHLRCMATNLADHVDAGTVTLPEAGDDVAQIRSWLEPVSELEAWAAAAASDGAAVLGYVVVHEHRIVHLFVDPEQQGRGIGGALLRYAEEVLAARGAVELELHTRVENAAAVAFYEAAGWAVTGRITTVEHDNTYDEHVLTKGAATR